MAGLVPRVHPGRGRCGGARGGAASRSRRASKTPAPRRWPSLSTASIRIGAVVSGPGRGRPRHPDVLTPAEWRVVHAVRHGLTNRQIAERVGVSRDAVKFHVANALGKLGLPGRAALRTWDGVPAGSPVRVVAGFPPDPRSATRGT